MKALRSTHDRLVLADVPRPRNETEATVRVTMSGICNTDIEIVRGYAGFEGTIGHEFVGMVESAPGNESLVGKRVVGEINAGCGHCPLCSDGDPRHCPVRTVLGIAGRDGAHAEYLQLPTANLLAVPDGVSNEQAVFVEPLAAAYGITEQVEVRPETKIAVIGDGKLGLLCAMTLALRSKNVTLVGRHGSKMGIAAKCDVDTRFEGEIGSSEHSYFDMVVEASGSASGFAAAIDLVRPRGKIVLKSTFHGETALPGSRVVVDEVTIVGSRCGRFAPAIELLAAGDINVTDMIADEFRLSDGVAAMDAASQKGVLKVLLRP